MIRLLFVGEGQGDVGNEASRQDAYRGDLVEITHRILEANAARPKAVRFETTTEYWNDTKIRGARRRHQGQPHGFDAKLRRILGQTTADGVVALVDGSAHEARSRIEQLRNGRELAAQDGLPVSLRCAVGVAVHEIEAWLLADEQARCCGFGTDVGRRPLPAQPEEINDPKTIYAEREGESAAAKSDDHDKHLVRGKIVENMRVDEVSRRCPSGFEPFQRDVEERIAPLFQT